MRALTIPSEKNQPSKSLLAQCAKEIEHGTISATLKAMQTDLRNLLNDNRTWMALMFIIVAGFFTYAFNFASPAALFWDENYHIASAQKYLNGTYFMEPHPPLGKLLIALGEKLTHANPVNNQFIDTDYAKDPPMGFSFVGYRLIPTLLAWWTAPLLFFVFLFLTRKILWSLLFTFPYLFDNALIVHARSAMLESTMLFFAVVNILAFLMILEGKNDRGKFLSASILFGIAFACLLATKAFGLIMILLVPLLLWKLFPDWKKIARFLVPAFLSFVVVYCGIWQIHFSLGSKINPKLPGNNKNIYTPSDGYYQASKEYYAILNSHTNGSLLNFPVMLRDSLAFVTHYQRGVPRLNLCKADENGSPWFLWPIGARSINYRWATNSDAYQYLYLQSNPVVWFVAFGAVLLAIMLLASSVLVQSAQKLKNPFLLFSFTTLYICFMIAVAQITRVMYLYHYFLPLVLCFIVLALVWNEIDVIGKYRLTEARKTHILLALGIAIFLSFQFYRPLSYYTTIDDIDFQKRSIIRMWDLKCVRCKDDNPLVIPGSGTNS